MSENKTSLQLTTEQWPTGRSLWEVTFPDLGDDQFVTQAKLQLLYNNAAYDLTAAVIAILGREYSKLITDILDAVTDDDRDRAMNIFTDTTTRLLKEINS